MLRKIISILTVIAMFISYPAVFAESEDIELAIAAASGTCGENVTWTLDDNGTHTIGGEGAMLDYNWLASPFYNNYDIKTIIIENGVTSIGNYAFYECE